MLRVFNHYVSSRKALLFFAEAGAISLAGALGAAVASSASEQPLALPGALLRVGLLALATAGTLQFLLYLLDLYDLKIAASDGRAGRALRGSAIALVLAGVVAAAAPVGLLPQGALLGAGLGAVAGSLLVRGAAKALLGRPTRVLVLGNGERAREVARALERDGEDAFVVCAMVEPQSVGRRNYFAARRSGSEVHERAPADARLSLVELARSARADVVVTAMDDARGGVGPDALLECRLAGLEVFGATGFFERVLRRIPVAHLRPSELAFADDFHLAWANRVARRAFDLAVAIALLSCALPVMAIAAVLIRLDSPGPIFYRQERVGLNGRRYRLWKLRSMRVDAEKDGAVWARPNDDRVTRVGRVLRKTRMDELPQLFNVLAGEMSVVGPRPERPVFVEELKKQIPFYALREVVRPGITGWAQIRYPYGASVEDAKNKLEYDLYYVKHASPWLDVAIIFHTVRHVLLGRGAR